MIIEWYFFCSILLNCCSLTIKKKIKCTQTDAPFNLCYYLGFPPPPDYLQGCCLCLSQYTFDLAAQYLVSPAICVCTYPTVDLPHFIWMMNASTVNNTIKINVAITLTTSMQNFFLAVITASSLCCSCRCWIPVSVSMQRRPKPYLKSF